MASGRHIKIRQRSSFPKPWKWEMYDGERLVAASRASYSTQAEARIVGRAALNALAALDNLERLSCQH
jgi:hypothetical protein